MTRRSASALLLVTGLALCVAACGDDDETAGAARGGVTIVATTTQAADLARAVAGDRDEVRSLLAPNTDPHEYEPRPSDIKALADADIVVRSGGDLDAWLDDAIESSGGDAEQVVLIDHVETSEGEHGHEEEHAEEEEEEGHAVDPHWWQDPQNAVRAVEALKAALSRVDPENATAYAANAQRYTRQLEDLDRAVAACIDQVPPAQRKLVTTHDALGYYAQRYGLEVIGAVIPSLSTQAQASAGEVTGLIDTIRRERVKAIFAESSVNSKLEQAIADQSGATVGRALWADTLGPEGSDGATYVTSIASNTRAIVDGLTGGAVRCDLPG
jgi:ABC-type Zn uptake system ZnuABC Zn-binding protein ZnuA